MLYYIFGDWEIGARQRRRGIERVRGWRILTPKSAKFVLKGSGGSLSEKTVEGTKEK